MTAEIPTHEANDDPAETPDKVVFLDEHFNLSSLQDSEDGLFDVGILLTTVIHLDTNHSLLKRRFSQTPLDPSRVYDNSIQYKTAVSTELERRAYTRVMELGLPRIYGDAIFREVSLELTKRTTSNDRAAKRLFELLRGQRLAYSDTELIWRAKTGEASMGETGLLLLKYPQMESIEALKYTEPLDWDEISKADRTMLKGLGELRGFVDGGDGMSFTYYDIEDRARRDPRMLVPRHVPHNETDAALVAAVTGWKENIAEISTNGTTVQLVQKTTVINVNPRHNLGITPMIRPYLDGLTNLQPISKSWYWRIKPQAELDSK